MIPIPAWLDLKMMAAFVLGALVAYGPASCVGRSQANATNAAKIEAASAKVIAASSKAESAATLAEMARTAVTQSEVKELKEIVNEVGTDDRAGPAVSGVLQRLRENRRGGAR